MAYVARIQKAASGKGSKRNKTYVNVLVEAREIAGATLADWIAAHPNDPWNDPENHEFAVEITKAEYQAIRDQSNPLKHDGFANLLRWQQQNTGTGAVKSFGSWTDPTDDQTPWLTTAIPDDRQIVRIFDDDPTTIGVHVASEDFDEDTATPSVLRYMKLYSKLDVPSGTNAQNQRTEIGGRLMDFDFADGVATFKVAVDIAKTIVFPSDGSFRVVGPGGEKEYTALIAGKTLR